MMVGYRVKRIRKVAAVGAAAAWALAGCSMKEEIKRIEAVKQAQMATESSRSTNLTGEQVFVRSCNTCHPGGRKGFGPTLIDMDTHFKTDAALQDFIRKGKGLMPPEPPTVINEQEMANLITYLRHLNDSLKEDSK